YSQSAAPKSLDELLTNPLVAGVGGARGPLLDIFTSDPYKTLMTGVTKTEYAGREKVGAIDAHHLRFAQDEFDWDLWVAAEDRPGAVQVKFEMLKTFGAAAAANEQLKNAKMTVTQQYDNWRFDGTLPSETFAFTPPEGAKKVDDFFAGAGRGQEAN